jgi:hypothetical protein
MSHPLNDSIIKLHTLSTNFNLDNVNQIKTQLMQLNEQIELINSIIPTSTTSTTTPTTTPTTIQLFESDKKNKFIYLDKKGDFDFSKLFIKIPSIVKQSKLVDFDEKLLDKTLTKFKVKDKDEVKKPPITIDFNPNNIISSLFRNKTIHEFKRASIMANMQKQNLVKSINELLDIFEEPINIQENINSRINDYVVAKGKPDDRKITIPADRLKRFKQSRTKIKENINRIINENEILTNVINRLTNLKYNDKLIINPISTTQQGGNEAVYAYLNDPGTSTQVKIDHKKFYKKYILYINYNNFLDSINTTSDFVINTSLQLLFGEGNRYNSLYENNIRKLMKTNTNKYYYYKYAYDIVNTFLSNIFTSFLKSQISEKSKLYITTDIDTNNLPDYLLVPLLLWGQIQKLKL